MEGLVAVIAGLLAGSISLTGFGLDSAIEVASGSALLWRMHKDRQQCERERAERLALNAVGACFIALAAYVLWESMESLLRHRVPEKSVVGIVLALVSLVVMPFLAKAKRRLAKELNSGAMAADAKQSSFCMYLSAVLLGGLALNAISGLWWADPVAALVMVPLIGDEGIEAFRGKTCCD